MEKMTIHRGLAELKLIDSKIEKKIELFFPTGKMQKGKNVGTITKKEFNKNAISQYDSITSLLDRKMKIKSAIVGANGKTIVKIGDKKMSVADAITFRMIVSQKKDLVDKMESQNKETRASIEKANAVIDTNALNLATAALQKDNVAIGDDDAVAITKPYIEANEFTLVDPLKVEKKITSMTDEIDTFETEIDATLSEINAITVIEI